MNTKTNQREEWEDRFDKEIAILLTEYGGISRDEELEKKVKQFISDLLTQVKRV